jgi:hypothetical protein
MKLATRLETPVVLLSTTSSVSSYLAGTPDVLESCRAWKPENASETAYIADETLLDTFVTLITSAYRINSSQLFHRCETQNNSCRCRYKQRVSSGGI